jgi:hypothetical protein
MVYIHANNSLLGRVNAVDYHEVNVEWNDECFTESDSSSDSSDIEFNAELNSDAYK